MTEECILRKFVADGEGTNEDKRLASLFTVLRKIDKKTDTEDDQLKIEELLGMAEHSFQRHIIISNVIGKGTEELKELVLEITSDIDVLMVKIEQVKEELESAKLVRKNKEEYDELARMVTEKPSREKTARNLEKLEASLTQLHDTQKELELKLAEKKQKVQALTALLDDFIEVPEKRDFGEVEMISDDEAGNSDEDEDRVKRDEDEKEKPSEYIKEEVMEEDFEDGENNDVLLESGEIIPETDENSKNSEDKNHIKEEIMEDV